MKFKFTIIIGALIIVAGLISFPIFTTSTNTCSVDSDCDDHVACTVDTCNAGTCEYDSAPKCGCYEPSSIDTQKCNTILKHGVNEAEFIADSGCIITEDNIKKACCTTPYCGGQYNYLPINISIN